MKKKFGKIVLLAFIIVISAGVYAYSPEHPKVFDDADIFTGAEIEGLTRIAKEYGEKYKLDFVVCTVDEDTGKSVRAYADDFYDNGNFGWDDCDGSGFLFLIDMYSREIYISTAGICILYVDDEDVEELLDDAYYYMNMKEAEYAKACEAVFEGVAKCAKDYINDSRHDQFIENWYSGKYDNWDEFYEDNFTKGGSYYYIYEETMGEEGSEAKAFFKSPVAIIVVPLVIALIVVSIMAYSRSTKMTVNGKTYLRPGSLNVIRHQDVYINTTTTSRKIESSTSSGGGHSGGSSHRSSSGRSHGGGGRGF